MNEIKLWAFILVLLFFFVEGLSLAQEAEQVFIYQHANFGGAYMRFDRDQAIPNLGILETGAQGSINWNDQISSVKVGANKKIIVYEHINYGGASRTLHGLSCSFSGSYPTMPSGWNDKASSLKIMQNDQPPAGPAPSSSQAAVYENANYCGAYIIFGSTDQPDLRVLKIGAPGVPHWSDRISSIRVGSNMKLIGYQEPYYKGSSVTLSGPVDITDLSGSGWNDTISSLRVVPKQ